MVAAQETLSSLLQKFNATHSVHGSAVVTRDGLPMVSALPAGVNRETFAAMAATMMGAAETAASEVEPTTATRVVAEFANLRLVAVGAGPDLLFVTVCDSHHDMGELGASSERLAEQIRTSL